MAACRRGCPTAPLRPSIPPARRTRRLAIRPASAPKPRRTTRPTCCKAAAAAAAWGSAKARSGRWRSWPSWIMQPLYDSMVLCNQYESNSCSDCAASPPPTAPPAGTAWVPIGNPTGTGGVATPPTYVCPSASTLGTNAILNNNATKIAGQTSPLSKGNYAACLGNDTMLMLNSQSPMNLFPATTFPTSQYPTATWSTTDVQGAFVITDITRQAPAGTTAGAGKLARNRAFPSPPSATAPRRRSWSPR